MNLDDIGSLTLFAGSATGRDDAFSSAARELAAEIARRGVGIVTGGGAVGLMGQAADAALAEGGEVTGIMPRALMDAEIGHPGLTDLQIVADMDERKKLLISSGDAIVALPGGTGTLEEFFEAWTWLNIGLHAKPVALYDTGGYWTPLLGMIDAMVAVGFLAETYRDALIVADTPGGLFEALAAWAPPVRKWT